MIDIIINDETYRHMQWNMKSLALCNILRDYIEILEDVYENGIVAGNIHDNLRVYIDKTKDVIGGYNTARRMISGTCENFIKKIDEVDQELY